MILHQVTVSNAFPRLFEVPRPVLAGESPVITAGTLLTVEDLHMLPPMNKSLTRRDERLGGNRYGMVGGYGLLKKLAFTDPREDY